MNDVVVGYSTTFTVDKDNRIVAIRDVVTPLHSGGKLRSAFGYQLDIPVTAVQRREDRKRVFDGRTRKEPG